MKSFEFIHVFGLSVYCFTFTAGLQCYTCGHIDGQSTNDFFDSSCKDGNKPDTKFVQTCKTISEYTQDWSCAKIIKEGKLNGTEVKFTGRMCIPKALNDDGKFKEHAMTRDGMEFIKRTPVSMEDAHTNLVTFNKHFTGLALEDVTITISSCSENQCNSSSILKIGLSVCIISFAVFVSKFIELF